MSNILDVPQNFSTTLNVGGGIDNAQTSGIVLTSVTGLPTDGGMLAFDWANPINTSTIEYIEYTGLSSNTLTGVTRGQEGYTAVTHGNGAKIVGVISRAHIKRLKDNFTAEHDRSTGVHNNLTVVTAAQQSTPSTPSAGFDRLYFKSDDLLYKKTSGGTEAALLSTTDTQTVTNKRRTRRVVTTTQSATPTINTDNGDIFKITGLAQAITSFTTNLSGTPVDGDLMEIRVTDNGTARALTFGASFEATTVALPTTTVISTELKILFEWNATASKWDCVATA